MATRFWPPDVRPSAAEFGAKDRQDWLNASGPRYETKEFTLMATTADSITVTGPGLAPLVLRRPQISFASWLVAMGSPIGARLVLKVRIDAVGQGPRP